MPAPTSSQKWVFIVWTLLLVSIECNSKTINLKDAAYFIRAWGVLKYYSPLSERGKVDVDAIFLKHISIVLKPHTKEEFNAELNSMCSDYGGNKRARSARAELMPLGHFFSWIQDSAVGCTAVIDQLLNIASRSAKKNEYYARRNWMPGTVTFRNEQVASEADLPDAGTRLLALARFWNIINYYDPYTNLFDENWEDVLPQAIIRFVNSDKALSYQLAVVWLTTRINDGHSVTWSPFLRDSVWGPYHPLFEAEYIEGQTVIRRRIDMHEKVLKPGVIILQVDGKTTKQIRDSLIDYISASNEVSRQLKANWALGSGKDTILTLKILNGADTMLVKATRVKGQKLYEKGMECMQKEISYLDLKGDLAYLNIGTITNSQLRKLRKSIIHKRILIVDLRSYPLHHPLYKLAKITNTKWVTYARFQRPSPRHPGLFADDCPYFCGKRSKMGKKFNGKLILLVNECTGSQGETTAMALQASGRAITLGSQTAGTNGNVAYILLPGRIHTSFSGLGVTYPDGTQTQRVGIKVDIIVKPTIKGISEGRDELLEKALEICKSNTSYFPAKATLQAGEKPGKESDPPGKTDH